MIILIVYLAGCLLFLYPTFKFIVKDLDQNDTGDLAAGAALAMLTVWFWPAYIPGWWLIRMLQSSKEK